MDLLSGPATAVISIGTRKSILARAQAEDIAAQLEAAWPETLGEKVSIKGLVPLGDRDKTTALWDFSAEQSTTAASGEKVVPPLGRQSDAKGLWTNELEDELERGGVDVIVHCLKDTPTTVPTQFVLGAITARADPRDVVIVHPDLLAHLRAKSSNPDTFTPTLADFPAGSIIGTSSLRRTAQLRRLFPHLEFAPLRGNITTRLSKLDESVLDGISSSSTPAATSTSTPAVKDADADQTNHPHPPFSAIILAAAGIHRLNMQDRITAYLLPESDGASSPIPSTAPDSSILYAVGQGALCLEIRADDERVRRLVEPLICVRTTLACTAERAMLRALEGGCSVPVGAETSWEAVPSELGSGSESGSCTLKLRGVVVNVSGEKAVERQAKFILPSIPELPKQSSLSDDGWTSFLNSDQMDDRIKICEDLGRIVAAKLVEGGAGEILEEIKGARK